MGGRGCGNEALPEISDKLERNKNEGKEVRRKEEPMSNDYW